MSMKENNQTGAASFGMTAEEAAEILSKVSFSDSKNTEELLPTAWTTDPEDIVERLKAQRLESWQEFMLNIDWDEHYEKAKEAINNLLANDIKATWDAWQLHNMYPHMTTLKGPTPRKGGFCGHCSTITDKERRKLSSCPECGKSYFAYRGGKRK